MYLHFLLCMIFLLSLLFFSLSSLLFLPHPSSHLFSHRGHRQSEQKRWAGWPRPGWPLGRTWLPNSPQGSKESFNSLGETHTLSLAQTHTDSLARLSHTRSHSQAAREGKEDINGRNVGDLRSGEKKRKERMIRVKEIILFKKDKGSVKIDKCGE